MDDTIIPERPSFLDHTSGDTVPPPRPRRKMWRQTSLIKKNAKRDAKKRERIAARPTVYAAVKAGAETFQALRKATALDPTYIRSALRFYVNQQRAIQKIGSRYYVEK